MKAITISKPGAVAEVSDIAVPEPGDGQILVKTIFTAINPVDDFMAQLGMLVQSWPLVPGCDVSGIVIKAGPNAVSKLGEAFKEGDEVFGCTRLGTSGYGPWAEYFLFDAALAIPKPANVTLAEASTIGVGLLTASLGVFGGLRIPLLDPSAHAAVRDEWALVFGGASSVGKYALQLLKLSGFKVVTTCSAKSFDLLRTTGADVCVDYKLPEAEIVGQIERITGGQLNYAFDAVSVNNALLSSLFAAIPAPTVNKFRIYTTTNDWDPLPQGDFIKAPIMLGPIGRPEATELNGTLSSFIPVIVKLLEHGKLKFGEYTVEGEWIEGILKAWEVQRSGKAASTKVVVKVVVA